MTASTRTSWHAAGERFSSMTVWVNKVYSEAGTVALQSTDWRCNPKVDLGLLADPRDMDRLLQGFRMIASLAALPALQSAISDAFPATYSSRVRRFSRHTIANRVLTQAVARLLDGPSPLRRALIRRFIMENADLDSILHEPGALEAYARRACFTVWHASCTCRMGAVNDRNSVTDAMGRVKGVDGLHVVDASIFPSLPRANTNIPTIMVAEKIADQLLKENTGHTAEAADLAYATRLY